MNSRKRSRDLKPRGVTNLKINPTVKPLARIAFPEYTGRMIQVVNATTITLSDTNWGGGTRSQYRAVRLADGKIAAFTAPAPWLNGAEGETVTIPEGHVVVKHAMFCGRDAGICIYGRMANQLEGGTN